MTVLVVSCRVFRWFDFFRTILADLKVLYSRFKVPSVSQLLIMVIMIIITKLNVVCYGVNFSDCSDH